MRRRLIGLVLPEFVGSCTDALGGRHPVDESIDIRNWWTMAQESDRLVPFEFETQVVAELKRLREELAKKRAI